MAFFRTNTVCISHNQHIQSSDIAAWKIIVVELLAAVSSFLSKVYIDKIKYAESRDTTDTQGKV